MFKVSSKIVMTIAVLATFFLLSWNNASAQDLMTNVYGRKCQLLNGKWNTIIDLYGVGRPMRVYLNKKPQTKTEYFEYCFDKSPLLNVPSDWNSQSPELKYYEGTIWYGRHFSPDNKGERLFLYFGAVNYTCNVYLNGKKIGQHEGGFTPFQIEITGKVNDTDNFLTVEVNNNRKSDGIPGLAYDWWNYGGITRDVLLVSTPHDYIKDYFIQLNKYKSNLIEGWVRLSEENGARQVVVDIPELNCKRNFTTDASGLAKVSFTVKKLVRWSPQSPKLYDVIISSPTDEVKELIGFRNLYVKGEDIYLNDKPIFFKGVSFHEEIAQRKGRAYSEADASMLLSEAKALGVNIIRLSHYPQNEYTMRMAEKMGILLWEEIPVWQSIDFANPTTAIKADTMFKEVMIRDRNRCALSVWGVANETVPSVKRNKFLRHLISNCRAMDPTRLVTAASDGARYNNDNQDFEVNDSILDELDFVALNKYMGWYHPWPTTPDKVKWNVAKGKPLVFSEFGGEALFGNIGNADVKSAWSEDYQAQLYKDNIEMFSHIKNLRGIFPWALFDFRSPYRFHPNQDGWNRKGLVSDQGFRKKAWYIVNQYYQNIK